MTTATPVPEPAKSAPAEAMRLRALLWLWLPLAVSFELMMLEGPAVQGAIGRLPEPSLHMAAWGLTMSLSLLIESPIIMLLSTAIALVRDADSYRALRSFTVTLCVACTALTGLIAFTPLFDFVAGTLMGQPADIVHAARPAMRIMLVWTAAIGWRRFYQGILIRNGRTRLVSQGTAVRLFVAVLTAVLLVRSGRFSGVEVAALTLEAAVIAEALVTTLFALPVLKSHGLNHPAPGSEPLTQGAIWRFHTPLAMTTLMTLIAQPMTSAALARLDAPKETLAAWPVAYMALLVIRGLGLSLQEITVAQARRPEALPALKRFTRVVGGVSTVLTLLLVGTPLLRIYMEGTLHLPGALKHYVVLGVGGGLLLPLLTALGSWARGLLVARGDTRSVYRGMGLNLATHAGLLTLGVALRLPGMAVAAGAFTLAALAEYLYLMRRA